MQIKKLTATELAGVAGLFDAYRVFYGKKSDPTAALAFLQERMANNESVIFGAFDGAVMTGFTQLYPLFSSTRMKKLWLLNDLFVKEEFRGQGYSVALLERAKQLCRETGACGFMLETGKGNIIGNRLYIKTGMISDTEHNVYNWNVE